MNQGVKTNLAKLLATENLVVEHANVFVISHKQSLHDRFEDLIQFEKVKGFSRMTS